MRTVIVNIESDNPTMIIASDDYPKTLFSFEGVKSDFYKLYQHLKTVFDKEDQNGSEKE